MYLSLLSLFTNALFFTQPIFNVSRTKFSLRNLWNSTGTLAGRMINFTLDSSQLETGGSDHRYYIVSNSKNLKSLKFYNDISYYSPIQNVLAARRLHDDDVKFL